MHNIKLAVVALALGIATGCTNLAAPTNPGTVSNAVRNDMGKMAIRGPTEPRISVTAQVDNKGEAAGKTAAAAGIGWLNASMEAASGAEEPLSGTLIFALGLITTPIVAAGGAVYGATAADTIEAMALGNRVIEDTLEFAPEHFKEALAENFAEHAPLSYEFVPVAASDAELKAAGFNSVMDLRMERLASTPSASQFHVHFDTHNRVALKRLNDGTLMESRSYAAQSNDRAISSWAGEEGQVLLTDLDGHFTAIASDIADDFFLSPAIHVKGVQPIAPYWWSSGMIPGTVPMFVWAAMDGADRAPGDDVEYEIAVFPKGQQGESGQRVQRPRYVPAEPLVACQSYRWKVRAHYASFGTPTTSQWTPVYRFKTPCD